MQTNMPSNPLRLLSASTFLSLRNETLIGSKNGNFSALFDPEIELINYFDTGPNIWHRTVKDNSTMIAWTDASKLKQ